MWPVRTLLCKEGLPQEAPEQIEGRPDSRGDLDAHYIIATSCFEPRRPETLLHVIPPLSPFISCHIFTVCSQTRPRVAKRYKKKQEQKMSSLLVVWLNKGFNCQLSQKFRVCFFFLTSILYHHLPHVQWEHDLTLITTSNAQSSLWDQDWFIFRFLAKQHLEKRPHQHK